MTKPRPVRVCGLLPSGARACVCVCGGGGGGGGGGGVWVLRGGLCSRPSWQQRFATRVTDSADHWHTDTHH